MIRTRGNERGVILVLVLWIVVILSLIAYSLLYQVSTETSMTSVRKKQLRAEALARAGVAKAIIDLRNDMIFDTAEESKLFDAEGDVWARIEEGKQDVSLGQQNDQAVFNVYVMDEEGLFNLNRFGPTNMILLQKIIEHIGYNEEDAELVAAAIVDWRDADQVPSLPNAPSNEEGIAYAILRGEDERGETDAAKVEPVVFRNENFLTVDELLEVYGVTPELYFGPGTEEAEYYKSLIGERFYGERFEIDDRNLRRRRDRDAPVLGLRDYFTINGNGTLNVNTARHHVLAALAEAAGQSEGDSFAERVINTRRGRRDEDITNDNAFKDMTEVQANAEIGGIMGVATNLHPIGVQSTTFRIVSIAEIDEARSRMDVTVHRQLATLMRDETFEAIDRAEERRRQNSGRSERRQDKNNELMVRYPMVRIIQSYQE